MKTLKFTIFVLVIGFLTFSCKEEVKTVKQDGYTLTGTVKGLDNGYVKLYEFGSRDPKQIKLIDSVQIVNGKFTSKGKVSVPDMVSMIINDKYNGLFMLENSAITINIDLAEDKLENGVRFSPEVLGSKSHKIYSDIGKKEKAVFADEKYKVLEEVRTLYGIAKKSKKPEDMKIAEDRQKELMPLSEARMDAYKKVKYDFVDSNPNSPVAVHVLGYQYTEGRMTKEELKKYYNFFKGEARETVFFKYHITKVYKNVFENLGVGNTAPDFTLTSVKGEELTLSKIEGKYKLVDFWASWCIPCRASFPHLMDLYKKYGKDGFEVIGVGTADVEEKWRKAIKEDKTPWIHVFDSKVKKRDMYGPVAKKYGVPHLPTTFLMDSNQKIILRNPSKEELDAKLNELFGY